MTEKTSPARRRQVTSPEIAAKLIDAVMRAMDDLLALLAEETRLVKAGKLKAAAALAPKKEDLASYYTRLMLVARDEVDTLAAYDRPAVDALKHRHEFFRAEVQINLAVIATARDVAEELMRTVAAEVGRSAKPAIYGQRGETGGRAAISIHGIAVNRSA